MNKLRASTGAAGNRDKGRPKGSRNKTPAAVKDMILKALNDVGGATYLAKQAKDNPGPFMALLGKVLPLQVAGPDDENGKPTAIEFRLVRPGG